MRLIILDSDEGYLNSIRAVLSSQIKEYIEVFTLSKLKDLLEVEHLFGLESYLLIHEQFISDMSHNEDYLKLCQKNNFGLLSEGIIKTSELREFFNGVDPNCSANDIEEKIIMKYQSINDFFTTIKENYLVNGQSKLILGRRETHLMSLYHPYGNLDISHWVETTFKKFQSQYKLLIIHYDPFYHSKDKTKFNLSYLFTLIKREKKDLSLVVNEIKTPLSYNVDMITGPGNMLDIDCLTEEELSVYLQNLKNGLNYDFIIFNFNGVHITKHCTTLLENSEECILCHENEDIQLSVMRQTNVTWTMMMNDLETVIKEVINKYEK